MSKIFVLATLIVLSSCAVTEVALKGNDVPWPGSSTETKISTPTKPVHIVEVTDAREKKEIGMARTGVQYSETPIVIREDMRSYLNKYFTRALSERNVPV